MNRPPRNAWCGLAGVSVYVAAYVVARSTHALVGYEECVGDVAVAAPREGGALDGTASSAIETAFAPLSGLESFVRSRG